MGILDKQLADELGWTEGKECFLCGEPIIYLPCIYWQGKHLIFLHNDCAALFASHLQSDFFRLLTRSDIEKALQ